jgi:hypothetical protein
MSQTIAHRHGTHVHVPLAPIIALVVAAIVAAAVLILVNQPATTTTRTETAVGAAMVALPAGVSHRMSIGERRDLIEQARSRASVPASVQWRVFHNHHRGWTQTGAWGAGALVPSLAGTGVSVQHRLSRFPGRFPGPR